MVLTAFISILKLFVVMFNVSAQYQGQGCTLLTGEKGRCIQIQRCTTAIQQLLTQKSHLQTCDERNFTICCSLSENIVTPPTKCTQKCLEYNSNNELNRSADFYYAGNFSSFRGFIVGGVESLIKEFPHMAALGFVNENEIQWQCGGSLVSEQFVLTAAHCVSSTERGELKWIRLGDLNLRSTTEDDYIQQFGIAQIFKHPKYVPPALYNDIALVQLDHPVKITDYVRPACLHTNYFVPNFNLIAIGWGRVQFTGSPSEHLRKVSLDFFSNSQCNQAYALVSNRQLPHGIIDEIQICAGSINEQKDTCQGDSGGPLQIVDSFSIRLHYIIGITSFGKGCGTNVNPGVYTRVSYYTSWIEEIIWPK